MIVVRFNLTVLKRLADLDAAHTLFLLVLCSIGLSMKINVSEGAYFAKLSSIWFFSSVAKLQIADKFDVLRCSQSHT